MKKKFLLLIVLFAFSSCITIYTGFPRIPQSGAKQFHYEKIFLLEPGGNIIINSKIGTFNITGFNKKQVIINGYKSANIEEFLNDIKINIIQKGKTIFFSSDIFSKIIGDIDIEGNIKTPFETNIKTDIQSGALTIKSIRGRLKINGNNLDLNMTDISGKLDVITENGKIKLIILEWDKTDKFTILTKDGNIEFYAPKKALLNINIKTKRGKIEEKYKFKRGGASVNLITENGKIIIDKI